MRKVVVSLLVFLSLLMIVLRLGYPRFIKMMNLEPRAGVKIESTKKAKVIINQKEVGQTPYQDESLTEGEYLVSLMSDEEASSAAQPFWQGFVKLNSGTLTVINRDIGDSPTTSSGEVITLNPGSGVTIITNPGETLVSVDGKDRGKSPLTLNDLSVGEHQFLLSKDNFLKRTIRATVVEGFNLRISVDLALSEADLTKLPVSPTLESKSIRVKSTPTGFLRIRKSPNVNSTEVSRVSTGDTLTLLEELANWDRVRTGDGKEGYVSSAYVEKINP